MQPSRPMPLIGALNDLTLGLETHNQACEVCLEGKPVSDFPEHPPTAACKHSVKVCRSCLEEAIKIGMKSNMWNHISCPSCSEILAFANVKEFGDAATFAK